VLEITNELNRIKHWSIKRILEDSGAAQSLQIYRYFWLSGSLNHIRAWTSKNFRQFAFGDAQVSGIGEVLIGLPIFMVSDTKLE